jgi:hypothetical protein
MSEKELRAARMRKIIGGGALAAASIPLLLAVHRSAPPGDDGFLFIPVGAGIIGLVLLWLGIFGGRIGPWDGKDRRDRRDWDGTDRRGKEKNAERKGRGTPSAETVRDRIVAWHRKWRVVAPERRTDAMVAEADILSGLLSETVRLLLLGSLPWDEAEAAMKILDLRRKRAPGEDRILAAVLLRRIEWSLSPNLLDTVVVRLHEDPRGVRTFETEADGRGRRRDVREALADLLLPWIRGGDVPELDGTIRLQGGERGAAKKDGERSERDEQQEDPPHGGAAAFHLSVLGLIKIPRTAAALDAAVRRCAERPERRVEREVERVAVARAAAAIEAIMADPTLLRSPNDKEAAASVERLARRTLMHLEVLGALSIPKDPEILKNDYRRRQMEAHPDRGGSHEEAVAVNQAYQSVKETMKGMAA